MTDIDPQTVVDDFNTIHGSVTWVRYWTGTRDDAPKYNLTDGKAWLLGGHTPVVRVRGESSCIALTHIDVLPSQPDDIEDDSRDLPKPARAAERVREYVSAFGDGIYDVADGHPLYGRDLEALGRAGVEVEQLRTRVADRNASLDRVTAERDAACALSVELLRDKRHLDDLTAELAKVSEQLTAANRRADGLQADLDSAQRGLTAYANQTAAPNTKPDGPWKALIVHEGWAAVDFSELGPEDEVDIVIVRDSALPDAEGYMSGTYKTDDVAFTAEDIYVDGDGGTDAPTIYARAQVMAAGLNAAEAVAS